MAIKDFRFILEQEPDNKEVNKDLMEARNALNQKLEKPDATKKEADEKKKNKFVRVAIEEESDEEEEEDEKKESKQNDDDECEPIIEEVGGAPEPQTIPKVRKTATSILSKFPLKSPKEIEEHSREAKRLMQKGATDFMKKYEEIQKSKVKKSSYEKKDVEQLDKMAKLISEQESEKSELEKK